jgi:hypothetical protein
MMLSAAKNGDEPDTKMMTSETAITKPSEYGTNVTYQGKTVSVPRTVQDSCSDLQKFWQALFDQQGMKLEVVAAKTNQVALDIDRPALPHLNFILDENDFVNRHVTQVESWRSKSNDWHVLVTFDRELTAMERLQLALSINGVDERHAFYSFRRETHGQKNPWLLFKPLNGSTEIKPSSEY